MVGVSIQTAVGHRAYWIEVGTRFGVGVGILNPCYVEVVTPSKARSGPPLWRKEEERKRRREEADKKGVREEEKEKKNGG